MLQIRLIFIIIALVSLGISQGRMNGIGVGHFNKYQGIQNFEVYTKDNKKINVNYQKCEHVNFNEGFIKQNLKLYILPNLINHKFPNLEFNAVSALNLLIK